MVDQWVDGLKSNAQRIYEKINARIPNSHRFENRIADPASIAFRPVLNPAFISKHGLAQGDLVTKQAANIKRSYDKYRRSVDYAFATVDGIPAKRFKDRIDAKREDFADGVADRTLPLTGVKIESAGPVVIAGLWLVNDSKVSDMLRAGDRVVEGGPYLITTLERRPDLKAILTQRLTRGGANILRADLTTSVISAVNAGTNGLVQGLVDPGLGLHPFATGGDSRVDYIAENGQLFLEIQVSQI
jgi:hypothetical protein